MAWRFRRKKSVPVQLDFGFLDTIEEEFALSHANSAEVAAAALNKTRLESASYSAVLGSLTLVGAAGTVTISTADAHAAENISSMPNLEDVTMFASVKNNRLVVFCMSRSWQYTVKGIVSTAEGATQCD